MKNKIILIFSILYLALGYCYSQNITKAEYFIDTDPGVGAGTDIPITPADSISVDFSFSTGSLSHGYHWIFIRVKDENNSWNIYNWHKFYIYDDTPVDLTKEQPRIFEAEYFVDTDPGVGQATPITVIKADSISIDFTIPTTDISPGYHYLFVRAKDSLSRWSNYIDEKFFVIDTTRVDLRKTQPQIVAAEYYFNKDSMGVGNANPLTFTAGDSINWSGQISVTGLDEGNHTLHIRVQDEEGVWSLVYTADIYVFDCSSSIETFPYIEDFETGANGWVAKGTNSSWALGAPAGTVIDSAASGNNSWVTNLTGGINSGERSYVESPCFDFSNLSQPIIDLKIWYNTYGYYDGAALQISDDGGGNWKHVGLLGDTINWYNYDNISYLDFSGSQQGWAWSSDDWLQATHALDTFGGKQNVKLRIVFGGNSTTYEGFAFDDIQIYSPRKDLSVKTFSPPYDPDCGTTKEQEITIQIKNEGTYAVSGFYAGYSIDGGDNFVTEYITSTIKRDSTLDYIFTQTANMAAIYTFECVAYVNIDEDEDSTNDTIRVDVPNNIMVLNLETVDTDCNESEGSAMVTSIDGGVGPYTYAWTNGDTLATADTLTSGIYLVTVTDSRGCTNFDIAAINDIGGPEIATDPEITHIKCNDGSDGAINITVSGGVTPYNFEWSNGATTEDIDNLIAGPYEVIIADAAGCIAVQSYTITEPDPIQFSLSIVEATCGLADGSATVSVFGGTPDYTYNWDTGEITATEIDLAAGVYKVIVTDANICTDSVYVAMSETGAPKITLNSIVSASCGTPDGAIYISVSGGSGTYTYLWSNGTITEDLTNVAPGTYSVTVSDDLGACDAVASYTIPSILPNVNPICLVTVDSITQSNLIVWEKPGVQGGIDSYNIYKESSQAGVYFLIGNRPYDSLSVFNDTLSNPRVRSWRYKLSVVDTCGNESPQSAEHKTMHLTINLGLSNAINLIWDHYEGFTFSTYNIYRYSFASGWEKLYEIPNNLTSYTDLTPPSSGFFYYIVEVVRPSSCTATKASTHRSSRSNRTADQTTGVKTIHGNMTNLGIYPNPSNGVFTLTFDMKKKEDVTVRMFDVNGRLVHSIQYKDYFGKFRKTLNLSELGTGLYFFQIVSETGIVYTQIVIE